MAKRIIVKKQEEDQEKPESAKKLPEDNLLEKAKKFNYEPYEEFVSSLDKAQIKHKYSELRDKLSLNDKRESHGHLIQLIDDSARNYLDASDLFLFAQGQQRRFEIYFENTESKLIQKAQNDLEEQKAKKKITGQITVDLKKAWIIDNYEDQWTELNEKRAQLKLIKERMDDLKNAWQQRLSSLQSQAKIVEVKRQILGEKGR